MGYSSMPHSSNIFEYLYLSNPCISMRICLLQVRTGENRSVTSSIVGGLTSVTSSIVGGVTSLFLLHFLLKVVKNVTAQSIDGRERYSPFQKIYKQHFYWILCIMIKLLELQIALFFICIWGKRIWFWCYLNNWRSN